LVEKICPFDVNDQAVLLTRHSPFAIKLLCFRKLRGSVHVRLKSIFIF